MRFNAVSISHAAKELLQPSLIGAVHSVFSNAINIAFHAELIGIVKPNNGNAPFNLLLDCLYCFHDLWKRNTFVTVYENQLFFSNKITIAFDKARLWDPDKALSLRSFHFTNEYLFYFKNQIEKLTPKGAFWPLSQDRETSELLYMASLLINACKTHDKEILSETTGLIIGRGQGLTPSGDDFLCGWVVTLLCAEKNMKFTSQLSNTIEYLLLQIKYFLNNTTWPSQMMLKGAIKGWTIEPVLELIHDIFSGVSISLDKLSKIWTIGHSSGADMIAGIYHALCFINTFQDRSE